MIDPLIEAAATTLFMVGFVAVPALVEHLWSAARTAPAVPPPRFPKNVRRKNAKSL